jgi:hypothetical protein
VKLKGVVDKLGALLDPRGPLGEVLSPADVFKERAGLPVASPHVMRDADFAVADQRVLAPVRTAAVGEVDVPASRMRLVSRYVEEHYAPLYDAPRFSGMAEAIRANTTIVGWRIEQRLRSPHCDCTKATLDLEAGKLIHKQCGRARARRTDEEFVEHIHRLQIGPSDSFYNTYYLTIPGNDPVLVNGKVLKGAPKYDATGKVVHDGTIRGGTRITRGRSQYKALTKGMALWDKGFVKERDKAYAAEQKKWITDVRERVVKADKQMMPRKLGEL